MNRDYANPSFASREWQFDTYTYGSGADWRGSPDESLGSGVPLVPPDSGWDPVEELAYLLQEAVPAEQVAVVPPPHGEPPSGVNFAEPLKNLAQITAQLPP